MFLETYEMLLFYLKCNLLEGSKSSVLLREKELYIFFLSFLMKFSA